MWRAYLSGSTNALGCFNLIVSAYMNTTILRTRIVVIALMAGLAWSEGWAADGPAGEEAGKAFAGTAEDRIRTGFPALLPVPALPASI
jgi:hypothetical protein